MRSQGGSFDLALLKRQRNKARKAAPDTGEPQQTDTPDTNGTAPAPALAEPAAITAPMLSPAPEAEEAAVEEAAAEEAAAEQPVAEQPVAEQPAPQEAVGPPAQEHGAADTTETPAAAAPEAAPEPTPAPAEPAAPTAAAAPEEAIVSETLPVALEPELRRIIDTAVARVASIELEAIRESRKLTQRSEEEGREALKLALDRSFQLVNSFELLTVTVAGMVSALRVELDSAMAALHQVDDPYAHLTAEQKRQAEHALSAPAGAALEADAEQQAEQPAAEEASQPEPEADTTVQGMNGDGPEIHTEPSPEIAEMFREQIINMKNSGKTREEAERTLLRFNLGRRFIGMLDEVYSGDTAEFTPPAGAQRGRFVRRFFSRS